MQLHHYVSVKDQRFMLLEIMTALGSRASDRSTLTEADRIRACHAPTLRGVAGPVVGRRLTECEEGASEQCLVVNFCDSASASKSSWVNLVLHVTNASRPIRGIPVYLRRLAFAPGTRVCAIFRTLHGKAPGRFSERVMRSTRQQSHAFDSSTRLSKKLRQAHG